MANPKITIEKDSNDWIMEIIGLMAILLLVGLPTYYYSSLPDTIPIHFGLSGKPDSYSSKTMIWVLPVIGLFTYIGMSVLNNYPNSFNYPVKITPENAEKQYRIATKFIRLLNSIIACLFAYLTYASIQVALGNQTGLGSYFLPIVLLIIIIPLGIQWYKSKQAR